MLDFQVIGFFVLLNPATKKQAAIANITLNVETCLVLLIKKAQPTLDVTEGSDGRQWLTVRQDNIIKATENVEMMEFIAQKSKIPIFKGIVKYHRFEGGRQCGA